jgi:hypothetical protein
MRADGTWPLWESNNYGGRYTATMDKYCDYYAICVGAPNGLAEYHLETAADMLDKFDVDGIYLDDNITQGPNCPHWELHKHPRPGYDCLIEMHEVNWRRRRLLHQRRPHALLIDHCTIGFWLPLLSTFDVHLYGEGHAISTLEGYWNFYGMAKGMNAQGNIWPGGLDGARFGTPGAYALDLLTGGGQYAYIDWRLFTDKYPHSGAHPATAVSAYRNQTWRDCLVIFGNTQSEPVTDTVTLHRLDALGIDSAADYGAFDVLSRRYARGRADNPATV